MTEIHKQTSAPEKIGNSWLLSQGVVVMDASEATKEFIAQEADFTYSYYKSITQLLNVNDPTGGVIIENEDWTFIAGKFKTEMGSLTSVEGETIEVVTPDFDYCLSRL